MEESKENDFSSFSFSPYVLSFSPKQSKMGWMKKNQNYRVEVQG